MDFDRVVRKRRMVRNYTGEPIEPATLRRIVELARRAPSAGFSQGQSMIVVTEDDVKARIADIVGEPGYVDSGFDPWISRAGAIVLVCTSEKLYRDRYSEPDKLRSDGSPIDWPVPYWWVDAGATVMLLLLAAVDAGLAAGFLGCDSDGYAALGQLLGYPDHVTPIGMVTIGHPAPDRRSGSLRRGWRPEGQVVHMQRWND